MTISVDNAFANDAAMRILTAHFKRLGTLFRDGVFFHVRCCAHILNLMVQDGLEVIKDIVEKVHASDTYTKEEIDQKNEDLKELLGKIHAEYATLLWPKQGNSTSVSNSCGQSQRGKNEHASQEEGIYLCKDNPTISFDILDWWKSHEMKFLILSIMAAHILAIAITTVASEATFSAGGRVIDSYRASLKPDTIQVLICGGDWFRKLHDVKKKSKVLRLCATSLQLVFG
ncbi:zinc finger BED domain-containing protein RICESLEEPER 2-like protein [Tanacetum coccineum]